jgi:hypothetical protein
VGQPRRQLYRQKEAGDSGGMPIAKMMVTIVRTADLRLGGAGGQKISRMANPIANASRNITIPSTSKARTGSPPARPISEPPRPMPKNGRPVAPALSAKM